ncbi:hypothetical protein ACH5RR_001257 [Cinchona calisaya]|uniref:Uncharacterized protein n=1 Tax=Cinchona calisaya TaxID=153742 RepID=A0ABD3B3G5_9GENT
MIESMNSGSFLSLRDDQAYELLENLSVNSQQWDFSSHRDKSSRKSSPYEISEDSSVKMMLEKLAKKLDSLDLKSSTNSRDASSVCLSPMHLTQACPSKVRYPDCHAEQANALNFNGRPLGPTPNADNQIPLILSCLFLATSIALINCRNGVMQISFGNKKAELNIFGISRQQPNLDNVNEVNLIDSLTHSTFLQSHYHDFFEACLTYFGCDLGFDKSIEVNTLLDSVPLMKIQSWQPKFEPLVASSSLPRLLSIVEPPKLDLKPSPDT